MKNTTEYIATAHSQDLQWRQALEFYKDEITIFKNMISEVSSKNTSKEIKMMVSHFENQFIINSELIDELNHEINIKEDRIAADMKINSTAYEHRLNLHYTGLKGKIYVFEKLFVELQKGIHKFLSETM
jgi:hypothetical protein